MRFLGQVVIVTGAARGIGAAAELVELNVDVIIAVASSAAIAAKKATTSTPIVVNRAATGGGAMTRCAGSRRFLP